MPNQSWDKSLSPNSKENRFWILGSILWGLNQKSGMISVCKIHIYIDSESFAQIHGKI